VSPSKNSSAWRDCVLVFGDLYFVKAIWTGAEKCLIFLKLVLQLFIWTNVSLSGLVVVERLGVQLP